MVSAQSHGVSGVEAARGSSETRLLECEGGRPGGGREALVGQVSRDGAERAGGEGPRDHGEEASQGVAGERRQDLAGERVGAGERTEREPGRPGETGLR